MADEDRTKVGTTDLVTPPPEPGMRRSRLGECLLIVLVAVILTSAVALGVWKFVLRPGPGPVATAPAEAPENHEATQAVRTALEADGLSEALFVTVLPLPDHKGNWGQDKSEGSSTRWSRCTKPFGDSTGRSS